MNGLSWFWVKLVRYLVVDFCVSCTECDFFLFNKQHDFIVPLKFNFVWLLRK